MLNFKLWALGAIKLYANEQFDQIVGAIYKAALNPLRWQNVVESIVDFVGGGGALFYGPNLEGEGIDFAIMTRIDPDQFKSYEEHFHKQDVWFQSSLSPAHAKKNVVTGSELVSIDAFRNTEFCQDFLRQLDIFYLMGAPIDVHDGIRPTLSIYRPERSGEFEECERQALARLHSHIKTALRIQRTVGDLRRTTHASMRALDQLHFGVFLLGEDGKIAIANRFAENLLRAGYGLYSKNRQLITSRSEETCLLRKLVSEAVECATTGPSRTGGTMQLSRPFPMRPLEVTVAPVNEDNITGLDISQSGAIVFVSDPDRVLTPELATLQKFYGFTPAEAKFASAFVEEASIKLSADRLCITEGTARGYLKRIFAKTGANNQAGLMKLLLNGPALIVRSEESFNQH